MTAALGPHVSSTQNEFTPQTKNVDDAGQGKSFLAERLAAAPRLGEGHYRKDFLGQYDEKGSVGGKQACKPKLSIRDKSLASAIRADLLAADSFVDERIDFYDLLDGQDEHAAWIEQRERLKDFDEAWQAAEFEDLDTDLRDDAPDALDRVRELLPSTLLPFLDQFGEARRRERLQAILTKVGWKTLRLLDLDPAMLDAEAEKSAWIFAKQHPEDDARYQKPEHRRGRTPKHWKAKLKKQVRQARPYIAMALGAVGGKDKEMRPLYVSDYGVTCRRAELRHSRKTLEKLRIVNVNDPLNQIPMLEANERKKAREMAKRRIFLNIMQFRAEMIGAKAVWITITLPGKFHSNPTNSTPNANDWDWRMGPKEAMAALQERYHQTMCMLRERGIRAWGFWDNQAQQDSTPHKHLVVFVHDENETKALREARAVATAFRNRFPGQHGCEASLIGDDHPDFKPRKDKRNEEETVASIIRYTARYSTKMALGADGVELAGKIPGDDVPASEMERHAVWASERNARLHTVIGMDSQRAPSRVWDCVWKAAERGEAPADARMGAAVEWMRWTQDLLSEVVAKQNELKSREKGGDTVGVALLSEELANLQIGLDETAYHTALLCGLWADADMHSRELAWLSETLDVKAGEDIPLAPVPLRGERENAFGEVVKETIGIAAPIEIQEETDDSLLLRMPDGTTKLVRPSDDETRQIILKVEEWVIVDADKAKEMSEEAMQIRAAEKARWEEKQAEEKAMRKAFWESEMAQSPENEVEEGKASFDYIQENWGLSDIAISPRLEATPLSLGTLLPSDPPPI